MALARITDGKTTVEFNVVESENPQRSVDITENPVEIGENVNDHIRAKPISFSITGAVVGDDAGRKLSIIERFRKSGSLLTYVGRNQVSNIAIESFDSTHDKDVRNGFRFSITFKQIRIAVKKTIEIVSSTVSPTQVKTVENKGRQQAQTANLDDQKEAAIQAAAQRKAGG